MTITACPPNAAAEALGSLRGGLDAVCALVPSRLSWAEQETLVRELETARRLLEAARLQALEVFSQGGSWQDGEHLSASAWLRGELQVPRGDTNRDLALARSLEDWLVVQAALAEGRISVRSAGVLCSALRRLPNVDAETVELVVAAAEVWDPAELARALAARVAAADPERAEQDAQTVHEGRRLYSSTTLDSMGRLDAWLEPELAELFRDALDAESVRDRTVGDERSAAQRRHDAFGPADPARRQCP